MKSNLWVEVDYTIQITETGTAIMKVTVPFNLDEPNSLIKAANEIAIKRSSEVVGDKATMKVADIRNRHDVKRFYFDDGTGNPNLYCPIELEVIKEIDNGGLSGTDD